MTVACLRQLRWREPLHWRRPAWLVLLVVALLHIVFGVMTWHAMHLHARPQAAGAPSADDVLQVRFIAAAHAPAAKTPAPVPLPPPPSPRVPARHAAESVSKHALSVQLPAPAPAASVATPRLFNRNGVPILPAAASTAPLPEYVQRMPQGDTRIMQNASPVKYKATRFDKDWGRTGAITNALEKAVKKTTVTHTFDLGHGIHIHCGLSLAALVGGCGGDPPSPPSPKDGDVRLNMPPTSLAPNPHAPKPPPLSECIALFRAGKPLIDGCPSDTPYHAVDQQMREEREQREKRERQARQAAGG